MPPKDWRLRVEDMLEAIERIGRYTAGMDLETFSADERTVDAVVRNLEVIGEAARLMPDEVVVRCPGIPWSDVRAARNILAHEYFGVDLGVVWKTIQHDLRPLAESLRKILAS